MSHSVRELAKCVGFDFAIEDHGVPILYGAFEGDGWGQGFGYKIDIEFLQGILDVFRVQRLQSVNGKPCWVTHDGTSITRVEPLFRSDGTAFDVTQWTIDAKRRSGLLRGDKP